VRDCPRRTCAVVEAARLDVEPAEAWEPVRKWLGCSATVQGTGLVDEMSAGTSKTSFEVCVPTDKVL
jgi:hypothetical protein